MRGDIEAHKQLYQFPSAEIFVRVEVSAIDLTAEGILLAISRWAEVYALYDHKNLKSAGFLSTTPGPSCPATSAVLLPRDVRQKHRKLAPTWYLYRSGGWH